ncbi:MAG: GDP-mannose 4,6-dehydratase [Bdellovibrionales bacterium]|nr:GDP-mannose 4,6-dehydratase [Bdellovibrionales bacterium]
MGRIMITGGCGFVGHHLVEHFLKCTDWDIVVVDKLSYASNGLERLRDIHVFDDRRVSVMTADFTLPLSEGVAQELGSIDYIFHLGAETHVDRSIDHPQDFVMANVVGTMHLLNFARQVKGLKRLFYFSTDEVFGPAPKGVNYREWDRYNSGNPYAATKAGGEELCLAYSNTYKLPVTITHCMNIFGERQHPEKFIPKIIRAVQAGEKIYIHSDPTRSIPGSRFWIHARNVAAAILFLVEHGASSEKYNIVGEREVNNLEIAQFVAQTVGKPLNYELVDFHSSRPGHDLRYALDGSRMHAMGWRLPLTFEQSLERVVRWTLANPKWLKS